MIDSAIHYGPLTPDEQRVAKNALASLATLNVFKIQKEIERQGILEGDGDMPTAMLAAQIIEYRRVSQLLDTLHQLGLQFAEELNNA